jgi:peptidyl-prolyl cis-trans isomerase SurA
MIDALEWKPGLNPEVVEDNKVTFVRINKLIGPEQKKLDEARGLITADYQNYLEQQWIAELRAKYPYKVNTEVLSTIK